MRDAWKADDEKEANREMLRDARIANSDHQDGAPTVIAGANPDASGGDKEHMASGIEIRNNEDGSLDEVCAPGFHLEQMDSNKWWMCIDDPSGGRVHVWLCAKGKIGGSIYDERDPTQASTPIAAELFTALRDLFDLVSNGSLVRDTSNDRDGDWPQQMCKFVGVLQAANAALAKASPPSGATATDRIAQSSSPKES